MVDCRVSVPRSPLQPPDQGELSVVSQIPAHTCTHRVPNNCDCPDRRVVVHVRLGYSEKFCFLIILLWAWAEGLRGVRQGRGWALALLRSWRVSDLCLWDGVTQG